MGKLLRTRIWERLDGRGMEFFQLQKDRRDPVLTGSVVVMLSAPVDVRYTIVCTEDWDTSEVRIECSTQKETRLLSIEADGEGHWLMYGKPLPALDGCFDIDLSVTPSTNLLPIRRVDPAVGESFEATAAWVRFPELTLEPLRQRYTRLDRRRWRYESEGGFTAELEVDDLGIVTRYGDLWRAVGEG